MPTVGWSVQCVFSYVGGIAERQNLRQFFCEYDLMIMSYETMRIDVEWVAAQQWDYCILDEGHAIRNIESKVTLSA